MSAPSTEDPTQLGLLSVPQLYTWDTSLGVAGQLDPTFEPPSAATLTGAVLFQFARLRDSPPAEFVLQELPEGGALVISQPIV